MSGHSKWSTIKRKKGAADVARGKVFTKIAREIMVAAKEGGGDRDGNSRLRAALTAAKAANMPKDSQQRAIKKGLGDLGNVQVHERLYEGRGPGGVAFVLEVMTDNKNRAVAEIRHIFGKGGGHMGSDGSATWMFERKGVGALGLETIEEEDLLDRVMEAGGDDIERAADGSLWIVTCEPGMYHGVTRALEDLHPESAEVAWLIKPENAVELHGAVAVEVAQLWAKLDQHNDVQGCFCSATLPDDILMEYGL